VISLKKKQFLASQGNSYAKIMVLDVAKLSLKGS
jgi:hypothetical protein